VSKNCSDKLRAGTPECRKDSHCVPGSRCVGASNIKSGICS
jgi:hypothetical protein